MLNDRYGNNCSDGCVLPLKISGVRQNLTIKNLVLDYKDGSVDQNPENKIYDLDAEPAVVDFKGVLDMELFDWGYGSVISSSC